ncbi:hypothetical protein O6H91_12G013100 [Diphasiastrum complanatum]|uniref:Uncharacterized protein n=1 Tax=Diphasiastrum complanatum TaxID=34168 RepID=A0ACC2BYZ1_DIPCM|nr:hypothetical protein O6H91_12G013100 [Diphasiastrum complanatum]
MCPENYCRPCGFLLGLPFALLSMLLTFIGILSWVFATLLICICPCCICVAALVNFALGLIKTPLNVIRLFTNQCPC